MKISNKMVMLVAVPLVGMVVLLAVAIPLLNRVKVGGPEYDKITHAQDLKADILPPPEYLVESMLVVNQLATGQDGERVDENIAYLESLKTQFYDRYSYWTQHLMFPEMKAPFLRVYEPADRFWKEVDDKFVPAVREGRLADAQLIAYVDLTDLYKQHRTAVNETVKLADHETSVTEAEVRSTVDRKLLTMVLLVFAIAGGVLLLGVAFGRAISSPIRHLTRRAEKVAHDDLPRVIEEVQNAPIDAEVETIEPFAVDGQDELGDLAKAFNAMQDTSVRLASEQARMRRNVSEMFANLGRRNQSLLNRTISLISELEQNERDPQVLEDLFRIDHLTTRIRRNAESLLVLAGSDQSRMWSKPVELGDVIRTALSAIEAYDRVDFDQVQPVQIRGNVVNDVAHLLAELIENATTFSPPSSRVTIVGKLIHDGYVLSIIDQGLGMTPDEVDEAQRRIDEVAAFDMAPSKVLGLNVVGRIAARHGINVRLTESPSDGVTAKIRLPFGLIEGAEHEAPAADADFEEPAFAEYASAPVTAVASLPAPSALPAPAEPQSLHDFAQEWSMSLPPPEPGTMFGGDEEDVDTWAIARELTDAASESATSEPIVSESVAPEEVVAEPVVSESVAPEEVAPEPVGQSGLRQRRRKRFDITSRKLPPVYDWTAVAEAAEEAGHDWTTAAPAPEPSPAPSLSSSPTRSLSGVDHAELWGVGADALATPVAPPPVVTPAEPVAPPVFDWGVSEQTDAPTPVFESLVSFAPPSISEPTPAPPTNAAPRYAEPMPVRVLHTEEAPVEPVPAEPERPVETPPAPSTSAAAGLVKRVRGAQMPDTGPAMGAAPDPNRSAADVRSALSRFQSGVRKGQEDAEHGTDD